MENISLTDEQQVRVTLRPRSAWGQYQPVQNIQWTSSDVLTATVTAIGSDEGDTEYHALVRGVNSGQCTIFVTADADLGEGVQTLEFQFDAIIGEAPAVAFEFIVGEVEPLEPIEFVPGEELFPNTNFQESWYVDTLGTLTLESNWAPWTLTAEGVVHTGLNAGNHLGCFPTEEIIVGETYRVEVEVADVSVEYKFVTVAFTTIQDVPRQTQATTLTWNALSNTYTQDIVATIPGTAFFIESGGADGTIEIASASLKRLVEAPL